MRYSAAEQRAAVETLWPEISAYCEARGLARELLETGGYGVPLAGSKIMHHRALVLLDREELARKAGVGIDLIGKYETETRNPSAAALVRLCEALDCRPAALFRDPEAA